MANLLPDVRKWGVRGAATVVVASLLYQARDLVSDEALRTGVIVFALTLLSWILGSGGTEFFKRKKYPNPADWKLDSTKNDLYLTAATFGAIPCCALLLTYFWPLTPFQGLLLLTYGVAVGGLALPAVYNFCTDILWPIVVRSLRAMKFVMGKDGQVKEVPEDTPSDLYDHTLLPDQPTVPKKPKEPPSAD